ncbi:MAG: 5'/3'-nucleotidase SurE [Treponema sp.]|jgi:5'-nucleotidase|nr:5'/3'-nucleotidase SurE [Treponema sp.]
MNILLTNDDGIDSQGLIELAEALRKQRNDRVIIVAPHTNRSAISHAVSIFHEPIKLKQRGEDLWSCSGTPADCVFTTAMGILPVKPDLVISGINHGPNLGTDILYSGTAAAARQAALFNMPGIALSLAGQKPFLWEPCIKFTVDHIDDFFKHWKKDCFVNVNIPNLPEGPHGITLTMPAHSSYKDTFTILDAPDGTQYCFVKASPLRIVPEEVNTDWEALDHNMCSVSCVYVYPVAAP